MEKFNNFKKLVAAAGADVTAFYEKGNKAAGTRVRSAMMQLKGIAQEIRQDVTDRKNAPK